MKYKHFQFSYKYFLEKLGNRRGYLLMRELMEIFSFSAIMESPEGF